MNNELLKSKKFRVAVLAALTALLSFCVTEFGLKLDVEKTMALLATVMTPFLIYIGAEGYSERDAKAVIEESKNRNDISDKLIEKIVADMKSKEE